MTPLPRDTHTLPHDLPDKYLRAEAECERFLDKLSVLRTRFQNDERFAEHLAILGGPETAAVKRASLDLTRELAKLRRTDG